MGLVDIGGESVESKKRRLMEWKRDYGIDSDSVRKLQLEIYKEEAEHRFKMQNSSNLDNLKIVMKLPNESLLELSAYWKTGAENDIYTRAMIGQLNCARDNTAGVVSVSLGDRLAKEATTKLKDMDTGYLDFYRLTAMKIWGISYRDVSLEQRIKVKTDYLRAEIRDIEKIICDVDTLPFFGSKGQHKEFSNWFMRDFIADDMVFHSTEQWLMYSKARLFGDKRIANEIMSVYQGTEFNKIVKNLGRKVSLFDSEIWDYSKEILMCEGLYKAFSQNEESREKLLSTKELILVEASPYDTIWGIGIKSSDSKYNCMETWQGENLLGKCLMQVREELRKSD